ncbi:hypothetical protein CHS0354_033165 [Potamilus streckersoni]|uniref:Transmembrane protein 26 n=1 Tax=Potamilus streckersoni TaxID=2493646 RepID=A0AAE0S6A2_9BIVA|nr:hypothetical protein CHS0354_033165 [Potamilus streckersoni]
MNMFDILRAVLVRLVLLVHSLLVIWLTTSITKRRVLWLLAAADVGIILEGFVTIFYKKAKEWKWFCPCFFFYMLGTVPSIWLLEIHRMDEYVRNKHSYNLSITQSENTTSNGNKQVLEAIQGFYNNQTFISSGLSGRCRNISGIVLYNKLLVCNYFTTSTIL